VEIVTKIYVNVTMASNKVRNAFVKEGALIAVVALLRNAASPLEGEILVTKEVQSNLLLILQNLSLENENKVIYFFKLKI
jgi:hypothetical protein